METARWKLREACQDFLTIALLTHDEPALVWVLQQTVLAMREIVPPTTILRRVREALPQEGQ